MCRWVTDQAVWGGFEPVLRRVIGVPVADHDVVTTWFKTHLGHPLRSRARVTRQLMVPLPSGHSP